MKLNLILVFVSCAAFAFLSVGFLFRYLEERLELGNNAVYASLSRFITPQKLLSVRLGVAFLASAVLFIVQLLCGVEKMSIAVPVAGAAGVAGWSLTLVWFRRLLRRRGEAFAAQVLELTLGLASGMKSGLALGQALDAVSRRIEPPMREEVSVLVREVRLGVEFPEAFERLYRRMPCEDIQLLKAAVTLTLQSGGSLVEVLDEMTSIIRARTDFYGRLKNMTAQSRFEAMMISCAPLAALVILYAIDPQLMRPLVTTGAGWLAIGGAAALVCAGYWVIRKLMSIEV